MLKVLHTADWHLDGDPIKAQKASESLEQMVDYVKSHKINIVLVAGDIFEKRQSFAENSGVPLAHKYLIELAHHVDYVLVVKGNNSHDEPGSVALLNGLMGNILTFEKPAVLGFGSIYGISEYADLLNAPDFAYGEKSFDLIISLIPYPTKAALLQDKSIDENNTDFIGIFENILDAIGDITSKYRCAKITAFHGTVQGARLSSGQSILGQDIQLSPFSLRKTMANYYALGHIHLAQDIAPDMRYSGSIYNKNWGETEEKSFSVVEFESGSEADLIPLMNVTTVPLTASRPMVTVDAEFKGGEFIYQNHLPEGAQVRFRVKIHENERKLLTEEKLQEISNIFGQDVKIEPSIIPAEREMRSEKIMECKSLLDEVIEYAAVVDEKISDSIKAKVLTLQEVN